MSPIKGLEPRPTEIGRIRSGAVTVSPKGKRLPVKLEHWRLTSSHLEAINAAQKIYGGEVGEWSEGHGTQYELLTETDTLHVLVPPQDVTSSQYLELWSGGGVVRRCDGETELVSGGACLCAAQEDRPCKPTTHLRLVMPELPGIGTWRLSTQSWAAAAEIPAALGMLEQLRDHGVMPAADLVLEQRQSVSEGTTRNFAVPVIILPYSLAEVGLAAPTAVPSLPSGLDVETGELPPVFSTASGETGPPPAALLDAVSTTSTSAAGGTTSAPEEPELGTPAAVEYGADDDPGPEAAEGTPSSAGTASGHRGCQHLSGVRTVERVTGGRAEVCLDCGLELEVIR